MKSVLDSFEDGSLPQATLVDLNKVFDYVHTLITHKKIKKLRTMALVELDISKRYLSDQRMKYAERF